MLTYVKYIIEYILFQGTHSSAFEFTDKPKLLMLELSFLLRASDVERLFFFTTTAGVKKSRANNTCF
jgi:hypothetical protein